MRYRDRVLCRGTRRASSEAAAAAWQSLSTQAKYRIPQYWQHFFRSRKSQETTPENWTGSRLTNPGKKYPAEVTVFIFQLVNEKVIDHEKDTTGYLIHLPVVFLKIVSSLQPFSTHFPAHHNLLNIKPTMHPEHTLSEFIPILVMYMSFSWKLPLLFPTDKT